MVHDLKTMKPTTGKATLSPDDIRWLAISPNSDSGPEIIVYAVTRDEKLYKLTPEDMSILVSTAQSHHANDFLFLLREDDKIPNVNLAMMVCIDQIHSLELATVEGGPTGIFFHSETQHANYTGIYLSQAAIKNLKSDLTKKGWSFEEKDYGFYSENATQLVSLRKIPATAPAPTRSTALLTAQP